MDTYSRYDSFRAKYLKSLGEKINVSKNGTTRNKPGRSYAPLRADILNIGHILNQIPPRRNPVRAKVVVDKVLCFLKHLLKRLETLTDRSIAFFEEQKRTRQGHRRSAHRIVSVDSGVLQFG